MKTRIFRALVCFVLICAVVVAISPIRAKAEAFTSVALVYVGATLVCAAAITTLGVQANSNSSGMLSMSGDAEMFLDACGNLIEGGYVQLLRVANQAGEATYYMTNELLENLRCWLFDSGVVQQTAESFSAGDVVTISNGDLLTVQQPCHLVKFVGQSQGVWTYYEYVFSDVGENLTYYLNNSDSISQGIRHAGSYGSYRVYKYSRAITAGAASEYPSIGTENEDYTSSTINRILWCYENGLLGITVAEGFKAGHIPAFPVDGSSALKWSEDYGNRQLRVISANGGSDGSESPDDNKGKVWFPIALGGAIVEIADRTQEQQWTGETPQEFDDYTVGTELEILDTPEIDGFAGIEIAPTPDPTPAPGEGVVPPPDSFEPDPDGGAANDYALDLTNFFPFCIPFDLYEFFSLLAADPVAPVFEWVIPVPQLDTEFPISIDLSAWDSVAKLFRTLELLAFTIGLAMLTRNKFLMG